MIKHSNLKKIDGHPYFYISDTGYIYFRKSLNGKRLKIATGSKSIKEAKKIVDEKLIDLFSPNPGLEKRKRLGISAPLLKDIWSELVETNRPSSSISTLKAYSNSWRLGIEPFWGDKTTLDINEGNVALYENWYLKTHGKRVFFNTKKHLKMLFNYCRKKKLISDSPQIRDLDPIIQKKTKRKAVGRVYTDKEIANLLEVADQRTRIGIMFGRYMGMRKMEFVSLAWENIFFADKFAKVWSFKNKKWREIPIPIILLKELEKFRAENQYDTYIFQRKTGIGANHWPGQLFDKGWALAKAKANIDGGSTRNAARIHDLRHTFATETAKRGWSIITACHVLDMSSHEYQKTYTHITKDDILKAMNSIGRSK